MARNVAAKKKPSQTERPPWPAARQRWRTSNINGHKVRKRGGKNSTDWSSASETCVLSCRRSRRACQPPRCRRVLDAPEIPPTLRRLAGDVADQRWRLLEQWQGLLQIHDAWDQEHAAATGELETTAQRLDHRAQQLTARERELEARRSSMLRLQEQLATQRQSLEGRQAQLTMHAASWENERAALLTEVQVREESVAALTHQLEAVRQRAARRVRKSRKCARSARAAKACAASMPFSGTIASNVKWRWRNANKT